MEWKTTLSYDEITILQSKFTSGKLYLQADSFLRSREKR